MSDESEWLLDQNTEFLNEGRNVNVIKFSKAFGAVLTIFLYPY